MTPRAATWTDPLRLAVGTLSVVPVPPPTRVDRAVAAWAMSLAPPVGLLLAAAAGGLLWVLSGGVGQGPSVSAPLASALAIGLLALLTRGMHLDGLADTADGLGSGRPAAQALEVMRRGDVGPFGVVALVTVLLVQVLALAELTERGLGVPSLLLAVVVSRLALPLLCTRGTRPARADGLGATVVGAVGPGQLAVSVVLAVLVLLPALLPALLQPGSGAGPDAWLLVRAGVAVLLGLGAAVLVALRATSRLGGLTGDVLGAGVEAAFTTVLVVLTLLA